MKFSLMAIPAMALLQQHDARRDILVEPVATGAAACSDRSSVHSELGAFGTGGVRKWGRNRAVKTNRLVCMSVCLCVRSHISKTTRPNFMKSSVHVTRGRGLVLL